MANDVHEFKGKSVEDATEEGLSTLGLTEDEVDIEVISRGSRGIFGIGSEAAHIRIMPRSSSQAPQPPTDPPVSDSEPEATASTREEQPTGSDEGVENGSPDTGSVEESVDLSLNEPSALDTSTESHAAEPTENVGADQPEAPVEVDAVEEKTEVVGDDELAELAADMLANLVGHMGFDADVTANWRAPDAEEDDEPYLVLDVQGEELGALIGPRGETLDSLQYILRLMVNQRLKRWKNIIVDVEQYKERRLAQLNQLAQRMADQVTESGRSMLLEPMPANERRLIHLALRDHPDVYTESSGEGDRRQVQILAKE